MDIHSIDLHPSSSTYTNGTSPSINAEAGPSRSLSNHDPAERMNDSMDTDDQKRSRDGPKKKKASRACYHCQKAHLTCDDSRPCQRCIKRGCGDSCVEGQRKKAKYLLDEEELEILKSQKGRRTNADYQLTTEDSFNSTLLPQPDGGLFNPPLDPTYTFGSEAANLEYSMISAMLSTPVTASPPPPISTNGWLQRSDSQPGVAQHPPFSANETTVVSSPESYRHPIQTPGQTMPPQQMPFTQRNMLPPDFQRRDSMASVLSQPYPASPLPLDLPHGQQNHLQQHPQTPNTAVETFHSPISHVGSVSSGPQHVSQRHLMGGGYSLPPPDTMDLDFAHDAYAKVTAPYDYTAGYHYLMKYLQNGSFDKNDILRIVRALAIFRPSLIALQMPLTSEDEIFVEKCFQRSLLELEKLITMSGTPTVVWRRTGEICFVGLEFSLLTEWPRHELLGGRKFIYELFEAQSTVEYWENFAQHAFENTTQSVHSHCVLVKPTGQHIPCTFCFSIRRDLFDLPYIVIGQWLPML